MRRLLVVNLALLLVAACGSDGDSQQIVENPLTSAPTSEPTATNSPPPDASTPTSTTETATETPTTESPSPDPQPQLGDSVEMTIQRQVFTVSALEVNLDARADRYSSPTKGNQFIGVLAQFCLQQAPKNQIDVSTYPWTLRFPDGTLADSTYLGSGGELSPAYPSAVVPAGTCVRGWIPFEAPADLEPNLVVYAPPVGQAVVFQISKFRS